MTFSTAKRALVALAALLALSACLEQKPDAVKKIETNLGDENSAVNSGPGQGASGAAQSGALDYIGPGGEVVGAGVAVLNTAPTAVLLVLQKQEQDALAAELDHPDDPVYKARSDFASAKYNCFARTDCATYYKLLDAQKKAAAANTAGGGGGAGGHSGD